jgi:hypothetical protein
MPSFKLHRIVMDQTGGVLITTQKGNAPTCGRGAVSSPTHTLIKYEEPDPYRDDGGGDDGGDDGGGDDGGDDDATYAQWFFQSA